MSTRSIDMDDSSLHVLRRGVGVRRSHVYRLTYDLVVVADDVGNLVRAAGGWLCDRVRAGWQVSVVLSEDADVQPLRILGVERFTVGDPYEAIKGASPASVAVASGVVTTDPRMGSYIDRASERKIIEVCLWGDDLPPAQIADRFAVVAHMPSDAARAFKQHALAAAGSLEDKTNPVEQFHSVALWYALDGTDLVPVS